jgi:hypothetical protein
VTIWVNCTARGTEQDGQDDQDDQDEDLNRVEQRAAIGEIAVELRLAAQQDQKPILFILSILP